MAHIELGNGFKITGWKADVVILVWLVVLPLVGLASLFGLI